jgi:hypothetical protein
MFDEWLRTGKHTDHVEAPQATEEYRQAILSKLKENPTAKILYYKELNGASHANVLEHIAKGMQQTATPTETSVEDVPTSKDEATKALGRLKTTFAITGTPTVDEVTSEQIAHWKYNSDMGGRRTQSGIDAINADIAKVESYLATKVTKTPEPSQDTPEDTEEEGQAPETVEGLVKEYGYLGELLADEDVDKVFKQEVEKILKLKADTTHTKQSSFSSFVDLLAFDGGVEHFTRLAKNDPNISKLTNAANKLHNLMRLAQHITVLNDYHQGDRSINLKEYLDTRPELKSIFEEIRDLKTGHTLVSVIVDIQEAKDVLRSETEKLVTLVSLMYIQAAFEKGQQYLIDTNYADLGEVIFPSTLGLLSNNHIGNLQKHRVVGDDSKGVRKLITPTELAFLDKIDGVPVGELSKEDFETVKA